MKFIKRDFGKFNKFNMKWSQCKILFIIWFLKRVFIAFKWLLISWCNGRCHDITCSRGKCYITFGHNIIYSITLSTNSNTPRLYSQWLNSVIYWLINHYTDWARTGVTSFSHRLIFITSSITYGLVTLTIDSVTSFS